MSLNLVFGIVSVILLAGSPGVGAQSWREPADSREKARDRIQMVRMLKMTETLQMDRETAARFFAIGSRYENTKRQVRHDLNEDIQRLRLIMQNINPPEKEVRDAVLRIKNRKKDLSDLTLKQIDEELHMLRPDQQGRYMLFTIDFHREIQDIMREVREDRPPERTLGKPPDRYAPPPPAGTYRESYKERGR